MQFVICNIHLTKKLYDFLGQYVKFLRPKSDAAYVFLTSGGNAISSSCAWGILNRHFGKCNIGLPHFNANSWRRAGNTVIQETGDAELIEAASRQLTHSREHNFSK